MRYIDADALLNNLPDDLPYKASVKRVLIQAPTEDVVEVVRCKDCIHSKIKHLTKKKGEPSVGILICSAFGAVDEHFYCFLGERSDNGT